MEILGLNAIKICKIRIAIIFSKKMFNRIAKHIIEGHFVWIRCTSLFNVDSGIIENNLGGVFFLFLASARGGGSNPAGSIQIPLLTMRGKANIYLT